MKDRQTLTYGVLPTRESFDAAFDREIPRGRYNIRLNTFDARACDGFRLGDGDWTQDQLWDAITEIVGAEPDLITLSTSETEEWEEDGAVIYQVLFAEEVLRFYQDHYQFKDACLEIDNTAAALIEWANRFSETTLDSVERAGECLNYSHAYGVVGKDYARLDAAMDLVSSILETLGIEWV